MRTKIYVLGFLIISSVLFSFTYYQIKPWSVPEKNAKVRNPVKKDDASLKTGKDLWVTHCAICHGRQGVGDGAKAGQMKTFMKEMASASVQGQSDGALFYKISEGRDEMPSFKTKLSEKELWSTVIFIRSLKAK